MPFGAEIRENGEIRFRLFAPAVDSVGLLLEGATSALPMAAEDGWHELTTAAAKAGSRYYFELPDGSRVPDPVSRFQPEDVHRASEVIDPAAYAWKDVEWESRPWAEAVLYELHIGTFTEEGTFRAAEEKLEHLRALGITAIELMCVADFAGRRNWGYDGVLFFAPDSSYGRPEDMKAFIDAAHAHGIMILLDVVYNHFGPEGNYLPKYFPEMVTDRHATSWGPALNFDGRYCSVVRDFILHNAQYWVEEFHLDGLRLDAAHTMIDTGPKHVLDELVERVAAVAGGRTIHLILESDNNAGRRLERRSDGSTRSFTAQWNHDMQHLLGACMGPICERTEEQQKGETDKLGKALAEGFVIAAQMSEGDSVCETNAPPTSYVAFLQNHDLIGNRILGDRISQLASKKALRAVTAIYLLLPQTPMLFMGEEWGATTPFPYFCDFHGELALAVREGRRRQLEALQEHSNSEELRRSRDPEAGETFLAAKLQWRELQDAEHAEWFLHYKSLLQLRTRWVTPVLATLANECGEYQVLGAGALLVTWRLSEGGRLVLRMNCCEQALRGLPPIEGECFYREGERSEGELGGWSVAWYLATSDKPPAATL